MNISHEVLTKDDAIRIAKCDSTISTKPEKYIQANTLTYYLACNTWLLQIQVHDEWAVEGVKNALLTKGLLPILKELDKDSNSIVHGDAPVSDIGRLIVSITKGSARKYFGLHPETNVLRDDMATALQLMRYLKRFSPLYNDTVQKESLKSFLQNENATKMAQRKGYPLWLLSAVRDEIGSLLDWEKLCDEIENLTLYDFIIPTGSTYEGYTRIGQKIDVLASSHPEWFYQPFGLPYIFPYYSSSGDTGACRVQAVPKSYKASRIIAMEPLDRQAKALAVERIIARYLPDCVNIHDQGRNQEWAYRGSAGLSNVATLDASNASDLISKSLGLEVFPSRFMALVMPLLSTYTEVNGQRRPMQMLSTSGHALTFVLETMVYYGIAAAAVRYCQLFAECGNTVSVYGDDVVIASEAAQTAMEFYGFLGLKINDTKSYVSGPYRESCGKEYYNGIDISSTYYPRFPVVGTIEKNGFNFGVRMFHDSYTGKTDDCSTMLVDLQKRVFGVSHNASLFLFSVIKIGRPKTTASRFGEICNDCWAATDMGISDNPAMRLRDQGVVLPQEVVDACATSKHSFASLRYVLSEIDKLRFHSRAFDIYRYQLFLQTGPTYASPLDELLGVSEPPLSMEQAYGEGRLVWSYSRS